MTTAPQTAEAPEIYVTYERRRRLLDELFALRAECSNRLAEHTRANRAADLDLDNPAPEVLLAERRLAQLEEVLERGVVVDETDRDAAGAALCSHVTIRWDDGAEERYAIVTPAELGRGSGQISCDSPLGRALLGRRAGERISAAAPAGPIHLTLARVEEGQHA